MYRKILVPLDGSELSECVLPHVENVAKGCGTAEVVLLRVCEPPVILADYPQSFETQWEEHIRQETIHLQKQCRLYLNEAEKKLEAAGLKVSSVSSLGKAPEEILDYAVQHQVDLIIMATHGRSGIARWAFGSTAERVLHASPIPVMMIRPRECQKTK
jgi:nucleotide-binding universal stress UspA family protein